MDLFDPTTLTALVLALAAYYFFFKTTTPTARANNAGLQLPNSSSPANGANVVKRSPLSGALSAFVRKYSIDRSTDTITVAFDKVCHLY